jgi:serine protease Do
MKLLKVLTFWGFLALTGLGIAAVVAAQTVHGQRDDGPERHARGLTVLAGRGAAIGVSVRDVRPAEAGGERTAAGVLVDEVRPDSPAEKAGLKRGDIIVEFDGERVRSARQFSRVVQETPAGRPVKATVVRDGRRSEIEIVPAGGGDRFGDMAIYGDFEDYMRDLGREFGHLGDRQSPFDFNFDFDVPGVSARRLGVTVEELTGQLAVYFGAKDGLLVTSVAEGSSGERAGLKAGDVITSVNGSPVRSRQDLLRSLRDLPDDNEVTLGIVRDKKETSVKTKVEAPRRTPRGRPA